MKFKRITALLLAVTLLCGMVFAASFSDTETHWSSEYIEDMYAQGYVKGYSDGTFKPENQLTNLEALVFVSRLCTRDSDTLNAAKELHNTFLTNLLPSASTWAVPELAVCLAAGVVTKAEMTAMRSSFNSVATREQVAIWFVRALQLEGAATLGDEVTLNFVDSNDISTTARPYVYQLTRIGVVEGTDENKFLPKAAFTRAAMATMLSRAIDYKTENNVDIELNDLTDYKFIVGKIEQVTLSGSNYLLTVSDMLGATQRISVPNTVPIYNNSVLSNTSSLTADVYARFCYNTNNVLTEVRVQSLLSTITGTLTSVSDDSIVTSSGTFTVDRFTRIVAGTTEGGPELLNSVSGYNYVTVITDGTSRAICITFSGGSRSVTGLMTISNGQYFITGTDGICRTYETTLNTTATLNGTATPLGAAYDGCYVTAVISNDTGALASISASNTNTMVQASFRSSTSNINTTTISVNELYTGTSKTYTLASDATITLNGENSTLSRLSSGYFVTLTFNSDGRVRSITAVTGARTVTGTVESLTFGSPIVLQVNINGDVEAFPIAVDNLPSVTSGGITTTIDKLNTGDVVTVTVKDGSVSRIVAAENISTVSGVIKSITIESAGTVIYFADQFGDITSYVLANDYSVKYGSKTINLSDTLGGTATLTIRGDRVTAIDLTAYANNEGGSTDSSQLDGSVVFINATSNYFLVQDSSGKTHNVNVTYSTKFIDVAGNSYYINTLPLLSEVGVYGTYNGSELTATLVIVK